MRSKKPSTIPTNPAITEASVDWISSVIIRILSDFGLSSLSYPSSLIHSAYPEGYSILPPFVL